MRKYFDDNVEAVMWAMRHQKDGWFVVIDQTGRNEGWYVDLYLVESEDEAGDVHPSNYTEVENASVHVSVV